MSSSKAIGALLFTGSSVLLCARILLSRRSSTTTITKGVISTAAPDIEDCGKVICAKRGSIPTEVEAGKTYWYCTCGRSSKQPFCDGKHKVLILITLIQRTEHSFISVYLFSVRQGTSFKPSKYEATETKTVYFCGCKMVKELKTFLLSYINQSYLKVIILSFFFIFDSFVVKGKNMPLCNGDHKKLPEGCEGKAMLPLQ